MSQTARVLTGLVAGIVFGILLAWLAPETGLRIAALVEPFGKLWLNALQMTVVPLVFALVVVGINQASDAAHSGRVARQAIASFVVLLAAAAAMTAVLAPLALSMLQPDPAVAAALRGHAQDIAAPAGGWADALVALVPSNAVSAAAASAMLPLVTFALFFGFALTRLAPEPRTQVVGLLKAISDAMIVIVHWVLWAAPAGIFALVLALTARAGLGMLQALGIYILLECALYVLAVVLLIAVAVVVGKRRFRHFMGGLVPVQAVAASTQSSLATLAGNAGQRAEPAGHPRPRVRAGAADGGLAVPHHLADPVPRHRLLHRLGAGGRTDRRAAGHRRGVERAGEHGLGGPARAGDLPRHQPAGHLRDGPADRPAASADGGGRHPRRAGDGRQCHRRHDRDGGGGGAQRRTRATGSIRNHRLTVLAAVQQSRSMSYRTTTTTTITTGTTPVRSVMPG